MACCDVRFTLDREGRFRSVAWGGGDVERLLRSRYESWTAQGLRAEEAIPLPPGQEEGEFLWDETIFQFLLLPAPEGGQ